MKTVTAFNITTGNKEEFELIDLQPFSPEKYTERQIAILSKCNDGVAVLKQKRTVYQAYVKKDGSLGGASKVKQ